MNSIFRLENLQRAQLSNNEITDIPPEVGKLSKLKVLDLTGNKIKMLPPDLARIEDIEKVK